MSRLSPRNKSSSMRSSVLTLIRSSRSRFTGGSVRAGCGRLRRHAQPLLHDGARGGVLQELALLRKQVVLDAERGQCSLVKAAEDQFLLTGIGVDVADGEDSRHACLKVLGAHFER